MRRLLWRFQVYLASRRLIGIALLLCPATLMAAEEKVSTPWALRPVVRPEVPQNVTSSTNPIDAFVAAEWQAKGLHPVGPADKRVLLRRVYLDLVGLPPTPAEQ